MILMMRQIVDVIRTALTGMRRVGCTFEKVSGKGYPRSRAKALHAMLVVRG